MKTEKSIREEEDREREMSVSLTSATVIFTLYQRCADLCCREQTDRQTAAIRHGSHPRDI